MPFCAAAAIVDGRVGVDTFDAFHVDDPRITTMMSKVAMSVDSSLGVQAPALTQARVRIILRDGRTLSEAVNGARGYPDHPASDAELDAKFLSCATRALPMTAAEQALMLLRSLETVDATTTLTSLCRA
jgi:2-methylcitrate dehydratase PrpD